LRPESGNTRAYYLRNTLITSISDDIEQVLNSLAATGRVKRTNLAVEMLNWSRQSIAVGGGLFHHTEI
jgi:hypothetical protein